MSTATQRMVNEAMHELTQHIQQGILQGIDYTTLERTMAKVFKQAIVLESMVADRDALLEYELERRKSLHKQAGLFKKRYYALHDMGKATLTALEKGVPYADLARDWHNVLEKTTIEEKGEE